MPKRVETKKEEKKSNELTADEKRLLAKLEEEYSYHSKEMNAKLKDPKLEIKTFNYFSSWYIGLQKDWDAA